MFLGGLFALWAVVASPLAHLDHQLLTFHMVQHLTLMTVAAPLTLLGAPLAVLMPRMFARPIAIHPAICWLLSTLTVIGWHVPAMFEMGIHTKGFHDLEQASFFAAGLLFWWPVIQPWRTSAGNAPWYIPLYLFLATLPCDALSAFLTFCNYVVYPHYRSPPRISGISPLMDQEFAGALMWVVVTFAYLIPAAVVTMRILGPRTAQV